jgi:hypothetical protein
MQAEVTGNEPSPPFAKRQPSVVRLPASRNLPGHPRRRKSGKARTAPSKVQTEPTRFYFAGEVLKELVESIPATKEVPSDDPARRAHVIITAAAIRAAALSGGLALPPGPLGLFTIIPDLLGIWKIHNQMVADIAGAYGKQARLPQKQLVSCLFRHGACQLVRDVIARLGERAWLRRASLGLLLRTGVPVLGAVLVAVYAYFDAVQVGRRAIALLSQRANGGQKTRPRRRRQPSPVGANGARRRR